MHVICVARGVRTGRVFVEVCCLIKEEKLIFQQQPSRAHIIIGRGLQKSRGPYNALLNTRPLALPL